ncbi:MAG: metallophosphoesterase [Desulfobacterales bacterium]|nr:metallophosphoesterase [Desulfobacterales bacterium]
MMLAGASGRGKKMRFTTFAITYTLLAAVLGAYVSFRWPRNTRITRKGRLFITLGIVGTLWLPILSMISRWYDMGSLAISGLAWVGYLGAGFLSFLFTFLVIRDFALIPPALKRKFLKPSGRHKTSAPVVSESRRRFLAYGMNGGITAAAALASGYAASEARGIPMVKEKDIPVKGLPEDLDGFRIVQLTDIHVGPTIRRPFVEGVVDAVNRLDADVAAVTGDLVDGSVTQLSGDVEPLARVRARFGKFFVTGNHEYYSEASRWIEKVGSLGYTVLMNEHRLIHKGEGRILLAGVADYRAGRFFDSHRSDPAAAMKDAPDAHLRILLAHQPKSIFAAARAGFDLQISGHTHGGQFFPWNLFVGWTQPYVSGLHQHENTKIYVSRGTGYWGPPQRLGSPSEITLLRLVSS